MLRTKSLILFLFFFFSTVVVGQELYPSLTKQLKGVSEAQVFSKIEQIFKNQVKRNPSEENLLKLWKYEICDSLGNTEITDTLRSELLLVADKINHPKVADIYLSSGSILYEENQFEKGISMMHKALDVATRFQDYQSMSVILKEIGVGHRKLSDLKNAEKYLRKSLFYAMKIKDDLQIGNVYMALGNALREKNDDKKAMDCFQKSLAIGIEFNNARLLAGNYNNIGLMFNELKEYPKALDYFDKALNINLESGNKLWESFNYLNIANTYDDMKEDRKAIQFYLKSNKIKIELGDSISLVAGYGNIRKSYYKIKDYKNAYDYLDKYVRLNDTLKIREQSNLLKDLEEKYESDKKQGQIEHLKMSGELQQVKNDSLSMQAQKNRNISILSVIVAICLLVGVGILWNTNKRRRSINDLLSTKNQEVEETNQSLNQALTRLSEKNKEVIDSINYATYIQQAALPNISQLSSDLLQFELFFVPKDIVSGDFYFSYQLYKKSIFGVADCTGHGVPGAMVSLVGMNSLDKVVREEKHKSSASMVDSVNKHVIRSLQRGNESINDGMDISFCYLDHKDNVLHFTGANHTAFVIRKTNEIEDDIWTDSVTIRTSNETYSLIQLDGVRRPIGKSFSEQPFYEVRFNVKSNDRIVLFSDGYADQTGGEFNKKLKKGVMLSMLLDSSEMEVKDQLIFMKNGFDTWKGNEEQIDDVCLLIVNVF